MTLRSRRYLAHKIILDGVVHNLALLTITPPCGDNKRWSITIEPFTAETHSTAFHSGTITVQTNHLNEPSLSFS